MARKKNHINPQEGYQSEALRCPADILIGGGAAGVGKTFALLMEALRNVQRRGFGAVIFRRTVPQIRAEGGLWDSSVKLFEGFPGAAPRETSLEWLFPAGSKIKFSHMEYEKNLIDWQGSEIPLIGFDELTQFTKKMFFFMLSRNRSTAGILPYVRATCNPDPDSFVAELVDWWIMEDGFPDPAKNGLIRYFMRDNDNFIWGDTKAEVIEKGWHSLQELVERSGLDPGHFVKSLSFISGDIYQNVALLRENPEYLGNLNAQDEDEKSRLLHGNWKKKEGKGDLYSYSRFMDIFTNEFVQAQSLRSRRYITTDIAMKGSDKMVIMVWQGKMLIDFKALPKTKGNEVIIAIKEMAIRHRVLYSDITFDADGVGSFVDGFIPGSREFHNGARPFKKENYNNLKAQCFYRSSDEVTAGSYYIPPHVAALRYDDKQSLKERLIFERKAVKRAKPDYDGKLQVIPKQQMKPYLGGQSPDVIETFMMREIFELLPADPLVTYS